MDGETAAQLRETATAHGHAVTPKQLLRWHTEGLLPRPEQRHLGRGRGTVTVYPAGAAAQLLALLRLHEGRRLRVERAGWALWYDCWAVPVAFARDALSKTADAWAEEVARLRDDTGDLGLSEAAWTIVEGVKRVDTLALRRAVKRAGRKNTPTFKFVLLAIAAGRFEGFSLGPDETGDTDRDAFTRGEGLYRRSKMAPAHAGAAWLTGDLEECLRTFQSTISPDALRAALDTTTDEDLPRARDEWRALVIGLDNARAIAEHMFGSGAYGLAAAPRLAELDSETQAALLLGWLSLRRLPEAREGLPLILATLRPFAAFRQTLAALTPGSASTTEKPPRLLQQSGGMTHGKEPSTCAPSLPRPPDL